MSSQKQNVRGRWLPWVGLVIGMWGALPHFVSPRLNTRSSVEIVDHVVPGIVVVIASLGLLLARTHADIHGTYGLASGLVVFLAGVWMAATHVPLIAQAMRGEAPWGAATFHSASALAVLVFSLVWTSVYWDTQDQARRG